MPKTEYLRIPHLNVTFVTADSASQTHVEIHPRLLQNLIESKGFPNGGTIEVIKSSVPPGTVLPFKTIFRAAK